MGKKNLQVVLLTRRWRPPPEGHRLELEPYSLTVLPAATVHAGLTFMRFNAVLHSFLMLDNRKRVAAFPDVDESYPSTTAFDTVEFPLWSCDARLVDN